MSDHSISIVPIQSAFPDKETKAKEILEWLVSLDIVRPTLSDCVLSSNEGYAISNGARLISREPQYLPFNLVTNGLEITTERQIFDTGENGIEELICPNCKQDIASEDWDFLSEWGDNKSNNLTCPLCIVGTLWLHTAGRFGTGLLRVRSRSKRTGDELCAVVGRFPKLDCLPSRCRCLLTMLENSTNLPMTYDLEKRIWTDADFDKMGWHDNHIYKMRLTADLELDIDYIFKWNPPDIEGLPYTFWVAPATLVFKDIRNLTFEFATGLEGSFEIEDIERENKNQWTIITRQGDIQFISEGFEQFIRQAPSFQFGQQILYAERYGYSLDRVTNQENPNLLRDDIIDFRRQNLEHYENVKKRHHKKQELEALIKARDNNEIDTKEYVLKKKEINESIYSYDFFLKGTLFENW